MTDETKRPSLFRRAWHRIRDFFLDVSAEGIFQLLLHGLYVAGRGLVRLVFRAVDGI